MKAYLIALIACGSAVAACIILFACLRNRGRKGKQTTNPTTFTPSTATTSPAPRAYRDVEKGQGTQSSGTKAGEMVILAGAGAAIATTAIGASEIAADNGGGGGCEGGGGGCGGGGCAGGCGGCGGR
ncbi:hypothetical protein CJ030_MR8G004988 [Morella rubra]|uniref:Uncharacterized protein n=1 Tax=Morella rubra TaxID=262757 RepID=A0A6A1UQU4_9ROSI|nr:hypothetical protein CJ030_MR8G004988 [Morella rubra]